VKIVDKFQSEIGIPDVCKSNSNSNFKTEVQKFELCLTSLVHMVCSVYDVIFNAIVYLQTSFDYRHFFVVHILSFVLFVLEMGVMPEIAQSIEEMDWRFVICVCRLHLMLC